MADDVPGSMPDQFNSEQLGLEDCKSGIEARKLEDELIAGELSGEPQPFDFEAFKARKRREYSDSVR